MKYLVAILLIALSCNGVSLFVVGQGDITLFISLALLMIPILAGFLIYSNQRITLYGTAAITAYLLISFTLNLAGAKLSSLLYSLFFVSAFLIVMNNKAIFPQTLFKKALKFIIIAYFINIAIGQLLTLFGANEYFLAGIIGRSFDPRVNEMRYFGFASEPSYAAFVLITSYLALYLQDRSSDKRSLILYGLITLYEIWALQSIFGYILLFIILLTILAMENFRKIAIGVAVATIVIVSGYAATQYNATGRFLNLIRGAINGEFESIAELGQIDSSTFMRVAPVLTYADKLAYGDFHTYFGHGAAASTDYFTDNYYINLNPDSKFNVLRPAFVPAFMFDYGLLGGLLIIWFLMKSLEPKRRLYIIPIIGLLLLNANFNTQLFWFVVIVLTLGRTYQGVLIASNNEQMTDVIEKGLGST